MNSQILDIAQPFYFERIKRAYHSMKCAHWHNHFEIYYLLSGERKYFIDKHVFTVKTGDVILIPPQVLHKTTSVSSDEHERIVINVSLEYVPEDVRPCFLLYHYRIPPKYKAYLEDILCRIERETHSVDEFSAQLTKQYLFEVLVLLSRLAKTQNTTDRKDTLMEKAAEYICLNYHKPITLQTIAQEFSMNKEYFSQKFKEETGFGFNEYLTQVRIANAVKLLISSDLPITEVAYQCGFNDSNYFATVFKKIKKVTPTKYRKNGLLV